MHKITCRKYGKEMEGLAVPPFPGPKGQEIYETVSKKAWTEWQAHQVRLINEKGLSMIKAEDRQFLQTEMDKFFDNKDFEQAEGYVPETGNGSQDQS